jgi:hypothetical protein
MFSRDPERRVDRLGQYLFRVRMVQEGCRHCMDDPAIGQLEARRDHCLAESQWCQRCAVVLQFRPRSHVDGTGHAGAHPEVGVGAVDHRFHVGLLGDVSDHDFNLHAVASQQESADDDNDDCIEY